MPESVPHPPPTENELALLKAAYSGDLQKVQQLVTSGTNINVQSNEFYDMGMHRDVTPLMCAAAKGHLEIVRWLLEHSANPHAQTLLGKSEGGPGTQALHFAAATGNEDTVCALLDTGANPNAEGRFGRTPLTVALGEAKLTCAKLLLTRGASPTVKPKHKQFDPPLVVLAKGVSNTTSMVARNGKLVPAGKDFWDQKETLFELTQSLLAAGADPIATDSTGDTPLMSLARRIPEDISLPLARVLIEKGANPDAVSKNGSSPLLTAVLYNSIAFARLLLEHPVDGNRLTPRGTVLDIIEGNIATAERDITSACNEEARAQSQAALHDLKSFRELLIARNLKRKSDLPPLPAIPPKPEKLHIASDFLKLVNSGEAEWALLAVNAPFEAVSDAYFKFTKARPQALQQNVPLRTAANGEEIPRVAAVIKVKDSPWTIILRTIFYVRPPDVKHVASAAKELSQSLQTRSLTWFGTEETHNGHCELFENGKKTTTANNARSITLLTKENLHIPACYPAHDSKNTWLAVEKTSSATAERADFIAR